MYLGTRLRRLCQTAKLLALGPTTEFSDRFLVLVLVNRLVNTDRILVRGLGPHKFTPMPGVHIRRDRLSDTAGVAIHRRG